MEKKNTKKELKYVLSAELYDELRFVFRPDTLKNIVYKPEILAENKWQCCCGAQNELDVCTSCGMEKNTAFSKVNANYLSRHRRARIAKRKKAAQDQQAMMAAQLSKKNNAKKIKKAANNKRLGTLIGVLFLCFAIIICIIILFGGKNTPSAPVDSTNDNAVTTSPESASPSTEKTDNETTAAPDTTTASPEATDTKAPDVTTAPEDTTTSAPVTPAEPVELPNVTTTDMISTIGDGKWPTGASGNIALGGLVFSDSKFDYVAVDGITVFDKSGAKSSNLTSNKASNLTGNDKYLFYTDENYIVHRIDLQTQNDVAFSIKANMLCLFNNELYYTPHGSAGLYAANIDGQTTKLCYKTQIYTLNCTAEKLYFSTDSSLACLTKDSNEVKLFCSDGAKATSIIEITECIFYTGTDGKLKFYNPAISSTFGVEYPIYNVAITYVSAFENRVYIRTLDEASGTVRWYSTVWTPGNRLFAPTAFTFTEIQTNALFVTETAVYDGEMNRYALSN